MYKTASHDKELSGPKCDQCWDWETLNENDPVGRFPKHVNEEIWDKGAESTDQS